MLTSRRSRSNNPSPIVHNLNVLEYPGLESRAKLTVESAFQTMRSQIEDCIEEGRKLHDIRFSLYQEHGREAGERRFKSWLKSKDWGPYGGGWAMTSIRLAEFFTKLNPKNQEWLLGNLQKLSAAAIKRFAEATEIGIDFCLGLVERGVKSAGIDSEALLRQRSEALGVSADRAMKTRKLKVGSSVEIVSGFRHGEIGEVKHVDDESLVVEFADGRSEKYAPEQVKKHSGFRKKSKKNQDKDPEPELISELSVGSRIVVIEDDQGWLGARGTVVGEWNKEPGSWWVELDEVAATGTKHLYKTSQLRLLTVEEEKQELCSERTPSGQDSGNSSTNDPHQKADRSEVYTSSQVEELLARAREQWEREAEERFIGKKSSLREVVEQEVREEIVAASKVQAKLSADKRQLILQLDEKDKLLQTSRFLFERNEQLEQRVRDLEKAASDKGTSWNQPVFTTEAIKVINKDVAHAAAQLSTRVEELEKTCAHQAQTIEELLAKHQETTPPQLQETKKLREKTENLEILLKTYQEAEKEAENLAIDLAPIAVDKLGIQLRKGENGEKYRGLSAILNFVKKLINLAGDLHLEPEF